MKIAFVLLGCPKNDVDAESMLYLLGQAGHEIVEDPAGADVIVVNTCGFIRDAKRESVDTLLEMAEHRKSGPCRLLAATGCLTQRYGRELFDAVPEVDLMVGVNEYRRIVPLITQALGRERMLACGGDLDQFSVPGRVVTSPRSYAYLKIAEGCSNRCAYCAIPDIRGPYRSRGEGEILEEARRLTDEGRLELILVAQDTTRWGMDLEPGHSLAGLMRKILKIGGLGRIRVLYCYPELVTDELLELVAGERRVCGYLDIPLQHIDDGVLKRMNRRSDERQIRDLIQKIRSQYDITLRTTFITGFPGEGEEEYARLLAFVQEARFEHLGVFAYSPEEGTAAYRMKPRPALRVAKARRHGIMAAQQGISREILKGKAGGVVSAVADGFAEDGSLVCRDCSQAPDIDGVIYVTAGAGLPAGAGHPAGAGLPAEGQGLPEGIFSVRITGSDEYDMRGLRV